MPLSLLLLSRLILFTNASPCNLITMSKAPPSKAVVLGLGFPRTDF